MATIPLKNEKVIVESIPKYYVGDTLLCDILLDKSLKSKGFTIGYLYELFNFFEREQDVCIDLTPEKSSYGEWLKLYNGQIDMIIINQTDSVPEQFQSEVISSTSLSNDGIVCVAKRENYLLIQSFNYWVNNFFHTNKYLQSFAKYAKGNNKLKYLEGVSNSSGSISPYDNLVKRYSKDIGWDWRLVSSLIYQESKFKAGVSSSRGAIGLMQIKESIGKKYGVDNIYDPEDNIKAGTAYLSSLHKRYRKMGADSLNSVMLALAAYNCGDSRLYDCMTIAKKENKDPLSWHDIIEIIPLLSLEEVYNNPDIKCGKFEGRETIKFVDEITKRYNLYSQKYKL